MKRPGYDIAAPDQPAGSLWANWPDRVRQNASHALRLAFSGERRCLLCTADGFGMRVRIEDTGDSTGFWLCRHCRDISVDDARITAALEGLSRDAI